MSFELKQSGKRAFEGEAQCPHCAKEFSLRGTSSGKAGARVLRGKTSRRRLGQVGGELGMREYARLAGGIDPEFNDAIPEVRR